MINNINGFHIEPTNICTLKCPGCARTQLIKQWPQHWKNYNLDIDITMNFLDIDLSKKTITFCGNYGDPIYHPEFIKFVQKFKDRGAVVTIVTNGSYKTKEWWTELVAVLTNDDTITFSIDGLPENFMQYRINADWASIKTGIDIAVNASVKTQWKYIPFSYNQNDIESTKELSAKLGIDKFLISLSDRFDDTTNYLKPDNTLLGDRYNAQIKWKNNQTSIVNPKCSNNQEHFITAEGFYTPCCYIADHRFYYKSQFGKNKKEYDINKITFSELLGQSKTINFYQNLQNQAACQFNCPG